MTADERLAWLESRRAGVGSSDIGPILGLSPWGTALSVYLSKINAPDPNEQVSERLRNGQRFEPAIAGAIIDEYGWTLRKVPMERHAEYPFILSNRDRVAIDPADPVEVTVEIKTAETYQAKEYGEPETDEVPTYIHCQIQQQLAVAKSLGKYHDHAWCFVQVGFSNKPRRYRVPFDDGFLVAVLPALTEFWRCVESRTPPEPDWSHPSTLEDVQKLFSPKEGKAVNLGGDLSRFAEEYDGWGVVLRDAEAKREEAKARLVAALGDAETGTFPDGTKVTRKLASRKGYTVDPKTYFTFGVKQPKGKK